MHYRFALCALECLAKFATVRELCAVGAQRLERSFCLSRFRTNTQSKTSAVNAPVIGIEVGIEDLERGLGLEFQPVDGSVIVQPAAHGGKISARELPLNFAFILVPK